MSCKADSLIGKKINKLYVESRAPDKNNHAMLNCVCDCGNRVIIRADDLLYGTRLSCGCEHRAIVKKLMTGNTFGVTHGESRTRLYHIWNGIKQRCLNPNATYYNRYGGRGIKICDEWNDYMLFRDWALSNGYKDNLSIERIDVNGDYCPENCTWITMHDQNYNRQTSRIIEFNGRRQTVAEWAHELNIPNALLWARLYKRNWPIEKALTKPINHHAKPVLSANHIIEYDGNKKTIKEWANDLHISVGALMNRIRRGWTLEKALC